MTRLAMRPQRLYGVCSKIFEIHRSRRRERECHHWRNDLLIFLFFRTRPIHSSEIRGLLSMKCSYERPWILIVYLMYHVDVFYFLWIDYAWSISLEHLIGTNLLFSEECLSTYLVPNTVWFMREHNFFWFLFHPFWLWILCFKSRRSPCVCVFFFLPWFVHRLQSIHELTAGSTTFLIPSLHQNGGGGGSFCTDLVFFCQQKCKQLQIFFLSQLFVEEKLYHN